MNKIYRLIWNTASNNWVVASEASRAKGKRASRGTLLAKAALVGALALPALFTSQAALAQWSNASGTANGSGAIAVGGGSGATATAGTQDSVAIGDGATASSKKNGTATPTGATAIGAGATATTTFGGGPVAIGTNATAVVTSGTGGSPVAIGTTSNATGSGSQVAIGDQAKANGKDAIGIGGHANSAGVNASGDSSTAIGQSSAATNTGSVSIGYMTKSSGVGSVALGGDGTTGSTAAGTAAFAVGAGSYAQADNTMALGANSYARGVSSMALGTNATAGTDQSVAIGTAAKAIGDRSMSLGTNSSASAVGGVALGESSVAKIAAGQAGFVPAKVGAAQGAAIAATTSTDGAVSVGDAANNRLRQITSVAAGTADTDAVNVSQLKAVDNKVDTLDANAVKYDVNPDGTVNYNSVTMGGTGGTRIRNVAQGDVTATSTDAVNGSQLYQTNQNVTVLGDTINNFAGDQSATYTDQNGRGIRYVRTNDAGLPLDDAYAQGQGSSALGYNAAATGTNALALGRDSVASHAGDVALGHGSTTDLAVGTPGATIGGNYYGFAGVNPGSTVSVGSVGHERTVTNVAAGRLSAASTDAVNGSQLYATNQALETISTNVSDLDQGAVKYDRNPDGSINYESVTLNGPVSTDGGVTGGTKITNVAQGDVNATSTDAVNGAQLYNVAGDTSDSYTTVNGRGVRYVRTNDAGLAQSDAFATGQGATAAGYGATASAAQSLALGYQANASVANSVALGANSMTNGMLAMPAYNPGNAALAGTAPVGEVSVGSAGAERRLTNVAAGAADTDGVNVSQLKSVVSTAIAADGAVKYDKNGDGTTNYNNVTMGGSTSTDGGVTGGTTITNIAQGAVTSTSTDAINGAQLYNLQESVNSTIDNSVKNMSNSASRYFKADGSGTDADQAWVRAGSKGVASGANAKVEGTNGVAMGNGASAMTDGAVAIGAGASATNVNSVALGTGSTTTRDYTVSVGSVGNERQIVNVAPGTRGTDAVNLDQLNSGVNQANQYTDARVGGLQNALNTTARKAYAGIAGATALTMIPDVDKDKTLSLGVGTSMYQGQAAAAVGGTARITENVKFRAGVGVSPGGTVWGVGGAYQW